MAQPRPTHEVFRQEPPPVSYDKFVPATSAPAPEQGGGVEEERLPSVDRLEELRRDDRAYLERVAQAEREDALEELERERREGERFRRERVAVKRRVLVADAVRGRYDDGFVGSLGLGSAVRKRRSGKRGLKREMDSRDKDSRDKRVEEGGDQGVDNGVAQDSVQRVQLVSGYSSSSEDGDDAGRDDGAEVGEIGEQKDAD